MPNAGVIAHGDNMEALAGFPEGCVDVIYIDPPFNTGKVQKHRPQKTLKTGEVEYGETLSYEDSFPSFLEFIEPRLREAHRILKDSGTLYVHLDWREAHRVKLLLDSIFGEESFLNELIWAYDYGGKSKRKWPTKHDTILVYVKNPDGYYFDSGAVDREPYMAPGLVGEEKAARGKLPTDVWWHTIVPTRSKERTGYPTQKPVGVVRRALQASCPPGGLVVDFFAGSGTTGAAALEVGARFVLVDQNPEAVGVMGRRFEGLPVSVVNVSELTSLGFV